MNDTYFILIVCIKLSVKNFTWPLLLLIETVWIYTLDDLHNLPIIFRAKGLCVSIYEAQLPKCVEHG